MTDEVVSMNRQKAIYHHIWHLAPYPLHVGFHRALLLPRIASKQVRWKRAIV
jgi:hypothetical protein